MESDCICLFCQRSDLTLYEINNNDVIIGSEIVSFQDLIYEVFVSKVSFSISFNSNNLCVIFCLDQHQCGQLDL